MELHPSSFLETGSCSGPRYVRSQPNRESPGILLDAVTDKYVAEFDIPYRNIIRYVKEIENNWPKLDSSQREIVKNSLIMFSGGNRCPKCPETEKVKEPMDKSAEAPVEAPVSKNGSSVTKIEQFGALPADVTIPEIATYIAEDPDVRVNALMDDLVANSSSKDAVAQWCYNNSYYKGTSGAWAIFFLILIIILLVGVGTGYNCK